MLDEVNVTTRVECNCSFCTLFGFPLSIIDFRIFNFIFFISSYNFYFYFIYLFIYFISLLLFFIFFRFDMYCVYSNFGTFTFKQVLYSSV